MSKQLLCDKRVFMRPPPGVAGYEGKCLILERALYGLPEAHKYFDELMKKFLLDFGFKPCTGDSALYVYQEGEQKFVLPLYVDDMIVHWQGRELRDRVLKYFADNGLVITTGPPSRVLGINMKYDFEKGIIEMHQRDSKDTSRPHRLQAHRYPLTAKNHL